MNKIKIKKISMISFVVCLVLVVAYAIIAIFGWNEFKAFQTVNEEYSEFEDCIYSMQDASDYLTEQVRLYVLTGNIEYMDAYFEETENTKNRENALEIIKEKYNDTDIYDELKKALKKSNELEKIEYHAMRLVAYNNHLSEDSLYEELKNVELSTAEKKMSSSELLKEAQTLVSDDTYVEMKNEINTYTTDSLKALTKETENKQSRAIGIFKDVYRKMNIFVIVLLVLITLLYYLIKYGVVKPLIQFEDSFKKSDLLPLTGVQELQTVAKTYNAVYLENEETQKIIRHEAEYDSLTDLLNRRYFDKVLNIYESGPSNCALILVDVDTFKVFNDTYGHAVGDKVLQKVANTLKSSFRNVDYVCRIGGDEFAIIMVEMTSDLGYTIKEKMEYCNHVLSNPTDDLPKISLSVGVAFKDRKNPGESLFKDADKALYYVKEHGRKGCSIYEEERG